MGLANINVRFSTNLAELSTQMQNASRQFKTFGEGLKSFGSQMSLFATTPILALGYASKEMASDLEQSQEKTRVVFKKSGDQVLAFAKTTMEAYGIAEGTALDMASLFGDMATSMGLPVKASSEMSMALTGLAGDIASFKNIDLEQAKTALNGVFTGETESLKMLGIVMTEANLQQYAYAQGIKKKMQEMSQSEKVMLRYNYVMEQTKNAHGDFAKELDSAANQDRVFSEGLKEISAQFGQIMLPLYTQVITKVNELMKSVMSMSDTQKKWVVGIAAVVAAIGPLSLGIGTVLALIPTMVTGFVAVKTAFASLTAVMLANPFTAIAAALAAVVSVTLIANSRFSELTDATEEYNKVTANATESVAKQKVQLEQYLKIAQNEKLSLEQREAALEKVKKMSAEYFGNLKIEEINTDKARIAVDAYSESLLRNAKIKAAEDKLVEVEKQLIDLDLGVSDKSKLNLWQNVKAMALGSLTPGGQLKYEIDYKFENSAEERKNLTDLKNRLLGIIPATKAIEEVTEETTATTNAFGASLKKVAENGSIDWLNEQIRKIEDLRNSHKLSRDEYMAYNDVIDQYKNRIKEINEINGKQTAISPVELDLAGSQDYYNKQLENLRKLRDAAIIGTAEWLKLDNQIKDIEVKVKASVDATTFENAKVAMQEIPYVYNQYVAKAQQDFLEKQEMMRATAEASSQGISSAFGAMSDFIGEKLGDARNLMDAFGMALIQNTIKAIGTALAQSTSNAILAATSDAAKIPFGSFALPALIGGAIASVSTAFASIPKFADGGIVSGPTFGLMGEYAGAANNPEVIAPLNKLKDLIEPAGVGDINISLGAGVKISGSDLMLVLERAERYKSRKT